MKEATWVRWESQKQGEAVKSQQEDVGGFGQRCPLGRVKQASAAKAWKAPEPEGQCADELLGQ